MSDEPYSLQNVQERNKRQYLLTKKHVSELTKLVKYMREETGEGINIPYFDPLDGGVNANVLFLLEAPGPGAVESGFISRNNPDPTARNFFELNKVCGLAREKTISWNIIPWYIGDGARIRSARNDDVEQGQFWLEKLLNILLELKYIVLVGKVSQKIHVWLSAHTDFRILALHHTSNRVKNSYPLKFQENIDVLRKIAADI